jgi:hypothetical protein
MPVTFTDEQVAQLERNLAQLQQRVLRVTYDLEMTRELIDRVKQGEDDDGERVDHSA